MHWTEQFLQNPNIYSIRNQRLTTDLILSKTNSKVITSQTVLDLKNHPKVSPTLSVDNNSLRRRLQSPSSSIHFKFTASQPLHLPIYNTRLPVLGSRLLLSLSSTNFHSIDILIYPVYLFYSPLTWSGCRQKSWVRSLMNRMLLLFPP